MQLKVTLKGKGEKSYSIPIKSFPSSIQEDAILSLGECSSKEDMLRDPLKYLPWIEYQWEYEMERNGLVRGHLVLEGVDTLARIIIGGKEYRCENEFRRFVVPWDDEGVVRIRFQGDYRKECLRRAEEFKRETSYSVPCPQYDSRYEVQRCFIRKQACRFSWDWGPLFPSIGIQNAFLYTTEIVSMLVKQQDLIQGKESFAKMKIVVLVDDVGTEDLSVDYELLYHDTILQKSSCIAKFCPENVLTQQETTQSDCFVNEKSPSSHRGEFVLEIRNPHLWWCNGYGNSELYSLRLECSGCVKTYPIGIRKLSLNLKEKSKDAFRMVLNDVPIFSMGASWIPPSFWKDEIKEKTERLLQDAKDANMNTLRVWGGGSYPSDYFLRRCSELGIIVLVDFMFACSLYPATNEFLDNVRLEVRDQVVRIQSFPCVAFWFGNNENEEGLMQWPECKEHSHYNNLIVDYHQLYIKTIYSELRKWDDRPFWPSSPSNGMDSFGTNPNDLKKGDQHYWEVFHGKKDRSAYEAIIPMFCSEFGFQSFPSFESIQTFLPDPNDWNISSPAMDILQRSYVGSGCIVDHLMKEFYFPIDFEHFIYKSQLLQLLYMKTAVEHWRRNEKTCGGVLYWNLNDISVNISWSSIDFHGRWKMLHYEARRFFSPVLLSAHIDQKRLNIYATSNYRMAGLIDITMVDSITGSSTKLFKRHLAWRGSECVFSVSLEKLLFDPKSTILRLKVTPDNIIPPEDNIFLFCKPKQIQFPPEPLLEQISCKKVDSTLVLKSKFVNLWILLSHPQLHFTRNAFHLFPMEQSVVPFTKHSDQEIDWTKLRISTLRNYAYPFISDM